MSLTTREREAYTWGLIFRWKNMLLIWGAYTRGAIYGILQYFGQNSIKYLGRLIWKSIPTALTSVESFVEFKSLIKNWKPSNCLCRLWKDFILEVGFVNLTQ